MLSLHKGLKGSQKRSNVSRAQSSLSVDYYMSSSCPSPTASTLTLTPGRIRNIDQDMENLRASRQDNPIIQQIIASRESLIDTLDVEEESDDANLMSKELSLDLDVDPLSLPEVHKHMIRSPPPTHWPRSPNFKAFMFDHNEDETISIEAKELSKSTELKPKNPSWDCNRSLSTEIVTNLTSTKNVSLYVPPPRTASV
ncbi:hypothetical protein JTB14_023535 [Gonioctena quinquepunctata]|nr:hypothetical protein JTB14_023535 [Gonioctena quinquepunctata]